MYDFDKETNRRNTGSLKWDTTKEGELPMWVADMDFETAPEIKETILKRAEHGVFGYSIPTDEWSQAYIDWWRNRHNITFEKDWFIFATGVIPILSSAVRKLTTAGENVLVQTPVYNNFFNSIVNNGRNVVENALVYKDGAYSIDFEDLEEKLADGQTTLMILCNPHNPVGKIWDKETLARIGELCAKHHVTVISDEIHCDLTAPEKNYIPFASVSEICKNNSITCIAPTKTFNIAGLQTAAAVVPNENLRHKLWRGLNTDEVAEGNCFSYIAAQTAFEKCGQWLDELRVYIQANKDRAEQFFKEELPQIKIVSKDVTYLLWLDCSEITDDTEKLTEHILKTTGLLVTEGKVYGSTGKQFIRMNVACTAKNLEDGLQRFKTAVSNYIN